MKLIKKILINILIWLVCLFVAAIIEIGYWYLTYDPYSYGPSYESSLFGIIVFVLAIIIAIALCKGANERAAAAEEAEFEPETKKIVSKVRLHPDENATNPAPDASVVIQPEEDEEIITTATAALEELEAQSVPAAPVKVSWKAPSPKAPSASSPKGARNKLLIPVCALAILLLLSLGGNVFQYLHGSEITARISELDTALTDANNDISDLENKLKTSQRERNSYKNEAADLNTELEQAQAVNRVFYSRIAFVIDDGTNLYHSYCCPYLQAQENYTYWAYNVEAAKWEGYRACPQCSDNFN